MFVERLVEQRAARVVVVLILAVESFLAGRLAFTQIAEVIESVLGEVDAEPLSTLEQVYAADVEARALAARFVSRRSSSVNLAC